MADFTLSSLSYARPYRSPFGQHPITTRPASTGFSTAGSIRVGQVVALDQRGVSTSFHKVYGITASSFAAVSTQGGVVGIACSTAQSNTAHGEPVSIWDANPVCEFKAVTKAGTLASSHVGSQRTLAWDSTLGIAYVDLGASTSGDERVLVTDLVDAVGDSGGFVAFKFATSDYNSTNNSSAHWLAFYSR